jgi:hypothetical protein
MVGRVGPADENCRKAGNKPQNYPSKEKEMKSVKKHLLMTIVLATVWTFEAGAGELLVNPGFEDEIVKSDGTGWDRRGGRTIELERTREGSIQGAYALKVSGRTGQKWEGVKQVVSLEQGKTYRIAGLMKLAPGESSDTGVVQLVKEFPGGEKKYQDLWRGEITAGTYASFQKDFSLTEENIVAMTLSVHGPEDGKSFIIDDFTLMELK